MTGIDRGFARTAASPITNPIAGCVVRFSPDFRQSEIVADGFRNAYAFDFNEHGDLFTYDSDNERCVALPWYEPTRLYHVIPGRNHGWLRPHVADTWRKPPYFCDVTAPLATLGRGSPTGLVCYRHTAFPRHYRGGLFLLDWTFGRIHFVKLTPQGASYTAKPELFLEALGDNGFAPTAAAVHPTTGDLYVSIGGRGTRGAVYRIRHVGPPEPADTAAAEEPEAHRLLRRLIELRRQGDHSAWPTIIREHWNHPDRALRQAVSDLVAGLPDHARRGLFSQAGTPRAEVTYALGCVPSDPADVLDRAARIIAEKTADAEARLDAVRLAQMALGDLCDPTMKGTGWEGYTLRKAVADRPRAAKIAYAVHKAFPSGNPDLDRELLRTAGLLQFADAKFFQAALDRLTDTSDPLEDIHTLFVLARLPDARPGTSAGIAGALLALDRKLNARMATRDRNWPLRLAEIHGELNRCDPDLNAALLAHPEFGRPDHAVFAQAPGFETRRAASLFLARSRLLPDFAWNATLVRLLGQLPAAEALPVLRGLWEHGGLEEAILPILARQPQAEDRAKFMSGLASPQLTTVERSLDALEKLPRTEAPDFSVALVLALRRLPDGKEGNALRDRLGAALRQQTGAELPPRATEAWTVWLAKRHPDLAGKLTGSDGVDMAAWRQRLARIDWSAGEAGRGRQVFVKASCAACHTGGQAIGPDLQGVAGRFARDDLFTAIVQPSRDIAPRYRTLFVGTADGKFYQGIVIYEAVDSLLLQTGAATTARIVENQIVSRRYTDTSLMPAGLLDKLRHEEIADLYAYLKSQSAAGKGK